MFSFHLSDWSKVLLKNNEQFIAISKNVVRENDECQLSNGDCTIEKKFGIEY